MSASFYTCIPAPGMRAFMWRGFDGIILQVGVTNNTMSIAEQFLHCHEDAHPVENELHALCLIHHLTKELLDARVSRELLEDGRVGGGVC